MEQRFQKTMALKPDKLDPLIGAASEGRIVTTLAAYVQARYDGQNHSGLVPLGARVVILPDVAEERTLGGIELPPDIVARNAMAAETGVLIAVGEGAFAFANDRIHPWVGRRPQAGDRVVIERYTGQLHRGLDGQVYRICEDRALGALAVPLISEKN